MAGVWHGKRSGRRVAVTVEPLGPLPSDRLTMLDDVVARLGTVLEATTTLTLGPVAVGPHA